ncbi:trans-aconitate 2-methyltransferase [Phyllobacterium zundukense]|jgi:trans-aconitate 2-methyltransferase|uniref:Trans-aconitate 2-methyltransferase n=1 Tax=Phyllobacterium zundukense TaxID=1867719 RepID=A0ACD4CUZ0_9HYPH|nr:trans-aconitate 2-methyltransferase [Phyllobacterium zundukense]UXN57288.1 trans-aconitate 2-methyltransferase [Phyllobacterium zundukense]
MRKADWSPDQYLKFEDERTRPANDLLSAVPNQDVQFAVDLGCGPGNSTELLVKRYPHAEVHGIDSSADMTAKAKERLPDCEFAVADIDVWQPQRNADLLYANAVMQWLPDHDRLFPRLTGFLSAGGSLAIQMPDNLQEATHVAMREVAADARWAARVTQADATRGEIGTASFYYQLLRPHCQRVDIWRTTYHHTLQGLDGIIEWFKGSALRPYLSLLNSDERADFLDKYRRRLAQSYKPMDDGIVLLPFPRMFIVATR